MTGVAESGHDPRIDAYIAARADFARPILAHLRARIHAASPEIKEAVKWGMPFFTYHGQNLCSMAAFKGHAAFGFWHDKVGERGGSSAAMGQFGRLTSLADLPDDAVVADLLAKAMALIDAGEKPRADAQPRAPLPVPDDLQTAVVADPAAASVWAAFPPGKIRDYVEWIVEAKQPATRTRRIVQAVEWIAQGKGRNWKYEKK